MMMAPRTALAAAAARLGPGPRQGLLGRLPFGAAATACGAARWAATATAPDMRAAALDRRRGHGRTPAAGRKSRFRRLRYLRDSPNATLALRLKSRTTALTFAAWKRFDDVARSQSMRLPVVALQTMIRQDEAQRPTSLSASLCSGEELRARLERLAFKGISEGDLQHWAWILAAADPDERIARFLSDDARHKPVFLLFQVLRRDETFRRGGSLTGLYNHIARHHVQSRMRAADAALPFGAVRRAVDPALSMAPDTFATLLRLLVHHYLRVWPSALPALARLVAAYVETLPRMGRRAEHRAYAAACRLFNYALVLFQRKSPLRPVFQMRYNWRAQKVLLAMSTTLPRPLLISRAGFRAIRRVLLALGKSPAERRVALRMARTWPPYRRDWDGRDELRRPQDDFSRSAQAGVLMREAGYADAEHDRALSVLGGVLPGEAATVQTRSLSPHTWAGARASLNVFSTWAARVKATRDVNEAWHEFQTPPPAADGVVLRPNTQVYAEMFKKLVAQPVEYHRTPAGGAPAARGRNGKELLPGDAKEVFPANDEMLTAFEKQRLRPPSLAALYAQMLQEGTRPVGDCLSVLVQNAPTLDAAMQYLHDSPVDRGAIAALKLPQPLQSSPFSPARQHRHQHQTQQGQEAPVTLEVLRGIPLANLNAYIVLMCRFQPRITAEPARLGKQRRAALIHHAIHLCATRLPPATRDGRTYRAPWHTILRTLAQPRLMVSAQHTHDRRFHDAEALRLALDVFGRVSRAGGPDTVLFDSLCRAVQKCLRWTGLHPDGPGEADLLRTAHATLVASFDELTLSPTDADADADADAADDVFTPLAPHHPATPHGITAGTLQAYLQTLGYLGDTGAMTRAMRWVLRTWDDWTVLEDAKNPDDGQHATMGRVFVMYRAFVEGLEGLEGPEGPEQAGAEAAPGSSVAWLEDQLARAQKRGCTWGMPSSDDADEFVRWHRKDHNEAFWARVRPHALL